jgi:hypothetical protein
MGGDTGIFFRTALVASWLLIRYGYAHVFEFIKPMKSSLVLIMDVAKLLMTGMKIKLVVNFAAIQPIAM